jgi:hypothetical protein
MIATAGRDLGCKLIGDRRRPDRHDRDRLPVIRCEISMQLRLCNLRSVHGAPLDPRRRLMVDLGLLQSVRRAAEDPMIVSRRKQTYRSSQQQLFRFREVSACRARAVDGELGIVDDLYIDPRLWKVRYIGVILEHHTEAICALIPPFALEPVQSIGEGLEVQLLHQEVVQAPGVLPGLPVPRELESRLFTHYGWPGYWDAGDTLERGGHAQTPSAVRPVRDLIGLRVDATDAELGTVEDLLFDDLRWELRYLQIEPRSPMGNGQWLISTRWLVNPDWRGRLYCADIAMDTVNASPRYGRDASISRDEEIRLHRHFGRPLDPA